MNEQHCFPRESIALGILESKRAHAITHGARAAACNNYDLVKIPNIVGHLLGFLPPYSLSIMSLKCLGLMG